MKTCSVCFREKQSSDFYSDRSRPDGKEHRCKQCSNTKRVAYQRRRDYVPPTAL